MFRFERSPEEGQEDSFQVEEMNRKIPEPTPVDSREQNYQLTFKKDQQGQYFLKNIKTNTKRVLFSPSDRLLLQTIAQPISSFYQKNIEELSSLPFADLYCLQLSDGRKLKLKLIGEIIEVKRLRMKITSVNVNIRCLQHKQNKTQEDKHRLFLLELLWKQLNKKVFIEGLKLNLTDGLYQRRKFKDVQEEEANDMQGDRAEHRISEQFIEEEEDANEETHNAWYGHSENEDEQKQETIMNQIVILNQILSSVIKRILFTAFANLQKSVQTRKRQQVANVQKLVHHNSNSANRYKGGENRLDQEQERQHTQQQDKQMILMPSDRKPVHYLSPSQQNQEEEQHQQVSEQRLQQLCRYIQQLHEQCAQSNSLLEKYFIIWKVFLLERIAQSGFLQLKRAQYAEEDEQQDQRYRSNTSQRDNQKGKNLSQILNSGNNILSQFGDSRLTSEISRGQATLKVQKKQLKEFIRNKQGSLFLNKLRDAFQLSRIALICNQVRNEHIVKRAFIGLKINYQQQLRIRQMEDYYNEVSNSQSEDDGPSVLFYKTNLLYRYFKNMQNHFRNSRVCRAIDRVLKSFVCRRLCQFSLRQKRFLEQQGRQMQKINNRLEFKYFRIWKQAYIKSQPYLARLKQYFKTKDREKLKFYFSVLSYHYKVGILQKRKAQKQYNLKLERRVLYSLKAIVEEGRQAQQIIGSLNHYLKRRRESWFIYEFKRFYCGITEHQRFAIKQEKLRRHLLKLQVLQGLRQWRKLHLRKSTYQVIQAKLTRLKTKQRKREIFTLWHDRTFDHQRQYSSNKSQQHKDWLVRYYGDLCAVIVPQ